MRFLRQQPSSASDQVYDQCGWCGWEIRFGDLSVTVNRNLERADEEMGIEVVRGEIALILCESCGSDLDAAKLQQVLETQLPA